MTDALDKFSLLDRHRLQEQFNAAYGVGILNNITLYDTQLARDRINAVLPDAIDHLSVGDDDRFWRRLNAALNDAPADPLDQYYSEDGKTLDLTGLGLTGTLVIVTARKAALENILATGNQFSAISIGGATALKHLILSGNVINTPLDLHTFTALTVLNLSGNPIGGTLALAALTALQYLNLHGCGCTVTGVASLHALSIGLDLTQCTFAGALDLSGASALAGASLNRVTGLTSVVVPAGISNFGLAQCYGVALPDLSACSALEQVNVRQNDWSSAQVDTLLAALVTSGATGGIVTIRYPYESDGIQHANGLPTSAGIASAATLTAAGWSVTDGL